MMSGNGSDRDQQLVDWFDQESFLQLKPDGVDSLGLGWVLLWEQELVNSLVQ